MKSCTNVYRSYDPTSALIFHDFPQNNDFCVFWKEACGVPNHINAECLKVCSEHFESNDYEIIYEPATNSGNYKTIKRLKLNAVPHLNLNTLNLEEMNEALEENSRLKSQLELLQKEKTELQNKIDNMNSRLARKIAATQRLKQRYDQLKKKRNVYQRKNLLMKVFSCAQIGILMKKRRVIWSDDDLAMAFTLRQMSNKDCYLYLKETLNIPLPALSCVQKWAASLPET